MKSYDNTKYAHMILYEKNDFLSLAQKYDADYNPSLLPVVISRGEGALLIDTQGHRTIDLSNIIANVGHCHPEYVNAVHSAAAQLIAGQGSITNPHRSRLFQKLVELTPRKLNKVFLSTSGSEACEWAIRIARRFTGRHEILSFWGGVHGRTHAATSMSGLMRRKRRFGPLMPGCLYAPYPYCYRCPFDKKPETCGFFCLHHLDRVIDAEGTDDLAALIIEPYLGVGGIVFPPTGYLPRLAEWAGDRGVLFILDEVQSSFGRTGKMFALDWEGLCPDILCLGKGLGGGISIGALVADENTIASLSPGELSGGSGGGPLACAAAMTVINILEKEHLAEHADQIGKYFMNRLLEIQEKVDIIGDVRGQGLSLAIEFVKDRESKEPLSGMAEKVGRACYAKGVFISGWNHILSIRPPLVITQEQAAKAADIIEDTIYSKL